jgi:hypothetical protein
MGRWGGPEKRLRVVGDVQGKIALILVRCAWYFMCVYAFGVCLSRCLPLSRELSHCPMVVVGRTRTDCSGVRRGRTT